MDLLEKYQQDLASSGTRQTKDTYDPGNAGPFLAFLQRLFGGKITLKQANTILIVTVIILSAFALWLLYSPSTNFPSQKIINDALKIPFK